MNYQTYRRLFQNLVQRRQFGNFRAVANAARELATAADEMQQDYERRQQSLADRCNHPRVDADNVCEVCGARIQLSFSTINPKP